MLCWLAFAQMYGAEQVLTGCSAPYAQSKADSQNKKVGYLKKYEYPIIITFT
jgi:hypothetical protein